MAQRYQTKRNLLESLMQLTQLTSDGDLISKTERDELVKKGLAIRSDGFNIITQEGIAVLSLTNSIHA